MLSGAVRRVTAQERRDRLGRRHLLAPSAAPAAPDPGAIEELAGRLAGLHASDPATPFLMGWARIPGFAVGDLERALYERRSVIRAMGMRRTMFVIQRSMLATMQGACTDGVAVTMRRQLAKDLVAHGVADDPDRWLAGALAATLAHLAEVGPTPGAKLSKAVPALQAKMAYALDKPYGGEIGVASRVLTLFGAEGHLERDRPNGSWTSSQHRWAAGAPFERATDIDGATADLVGRWLRAYGPAPLSDVMWWTGLGVGRINAAVARLDLADVDLDGTPGVILADDLDVEPPAEPWIALLPSLDSTVMGWQERSWYLGPHGAEVFDRNGNAGPTIWADGRVVGAWAQHAHGEVVTSVFDDVGAEALARIEARAAELEAWLGGVIVTPRFPSPHHKRLRARGR